MDQDGQWIKGKKDMKTPVSGLASIGSFDCRAGIHEIHSISSWKLSKIVSMTFRYSKCPLVYEILPDLWSSDFSFTIIQ